MLATFLKQNRADIIEQWIKCVFETYHPETSKFLRSLRDRFSNPVGFTVSAEIANLYDEVIGTMNGESIANSMDSIVRIRAVQDFSPSQAVAFVFGLKKVIKDSLSGVSADGELLLDLFELESRIDHLALAAFEAYMQCREKVHQIRTNEIRARSMQSGHPLEEGVSGERSEDSRQ